MSKTKQIIQKILDDRPDVEAIYTNKKGELFTEEYLALNSQKGNKEGIKRYARKKEAEAPKKEILNVQDLKIHIAEIDSINVLQELKAGEERSTAIKVIDARIDEIEKSKEDE